MKPGLLFAQGSRVFSDFWSQRNRRERVILSIGATVVLLGLLYGVAFAPAVSGREQLTRALPQLRQQVGQMQSMASEATGLAANKSASASSPMSKESLEASLEQKGLKAQSVAVTGDTARLTLPSASFSTLLDWVDETQKSSGTQLVDANVVALSQPDMVSATLTLRQQRSE
jgi:general secretion pathway protein M